VLVTLFGEALIDELESGRDVPGGAPLNVACHLRAFGLEPLVVSRLGDDEDGERLRAEAVRRGLDLRGLQTDRRRPTGRVLVHQGPRFEIPPEQAWDFIDAETAVRAAAGGASGLFYFGTLAGRHGVSRSALARLLGLGWKTRLLDLNLRPPWFAAGAVERLLASADVLKATEDELRLAAGLLRIDETAPGPATTFMKRFSLDRVVITRGPNGAFTLDKGGLRSEVAGTPLGDEVVDTVGAGDAFSAILILGLVRGWDSAEVLPRADAFARAVCCIPGAVPEVDAFYQKFRQAWDLDGQETSESSVL
jgi:fructokinase